MEQTGADRRILLVEDEPLVSMMLEEMVRELGFTEIHVPANFTDATRSAAETNVDVAIVDLDIWGSPGYAVVDILKSRKIPYILSSGYTRKDLEEEYRNVPFVGKPYSMDEIDTAIKKVIADGG